MSRAARFRQADVERVIRAAKKLGVNVELDLTTGHVRTLTPGSPMPLPANSDDLDVEYREWRAEHGDG